MRTNAAFITALAAAFAAGWATTGSWTTVQGQSSPGAGFGAVAGEKGGMDITGPYEVVANWPKRMSSLPGHENWTWGSVQGVFAESPDRVYVVQRGELPEMQRPPARPIPQVGPSLSFPVGQAPFRNASQGPASSPPGAGGPGADPDDPKQQWQGRMGVDARWEHTIVVVNAAGDIVEGWTQWDKMMRRPHAVYVSPHDAQKHVWVVDDHSHALFKFSHDGKQLVQTIGTPNQNTNREPSTEKCERQCSSHPVLHVHFHAAYTGGPTRYARFAPARGRNFCTRPPPTSATYRLPSWSVLAPCMLKKAPGKSPTTPHA